jgi:hypothetical protein
MAYHLFIKLFPSPSEPYKSQHVYSFCALPNNHQLRAGAARRVPRQLREEAAYFAAVIVPFW